MLICGFSQWIHLLGSTSRIFRIWSNEEPRARAREDEIFIGHSLFASEQLARGEIYRGIMLINRSDFMFRKNVALDFTLKCITIKLIETTCRHTRTTPNFDDYDRQQIESPENASTTSRRARQKKEGEREREKAMHVLPSPSNALSASLYIVINISIIFRH